MVTRLKSMSSSTPGRGVGDFFISRIGCCVSCTFQALAQSRTLALEDHSFGLRRAFMENCGILSIFFD
jgi:hypothetical protein